MGKETDIVEFWGEAVAAPTVITKFENWVTEVNAFLRGKNPVQNKSEFDAKLDGIYAAYAKGEKTRDLIKSVVGEILPITNEKDPSWEEGAQNLLHGCILAILQNKESKNLTMDKIKKISGLGIFDEERPEMLKAFFKIQSEECRQFVDAVINNAPFTTRNFLGAVYSKLARI